MEETEEIEERPACFNYVPSMGGLDFLVNDFQLLLDLIIQSLNSRTIYDHAKFYVLFELVHSLYSLLKSFRTKYVSKIYNEKWSKLHVTVSFSFFLFFLF